MGKPECRVGAGSVTCIGCEVSGCQAAPAPSAPPTRSGEPVQASGSTRLPIGGRPSFLGLRGWGVHLLDRQVCMHLGNPKWEVSVSGWWRAGVGGADQGPTRGQEHGVSRPAALATATAHWLRSCSPLSSGAAPPPGARAGSQLRAAQSLGKLPAGSLRPRVK